MMSQHWRDATEWAMAQNRECERENRDLKRKLDAGAAELARLRSELHRVEHERDTATRIAAQEEKRQRMNNATRLAQQLACAGYKLAMAQYIVTTDLAVTRVGARDAWPPPHDFIAELDPDRELVRNLRLDNEIGLSLKAMTRASVKTGTLRPFLSRQLHGLKVGDYVGIVDGQAKDILVQLTAPPVTMQFASVGEAHVGKEGLVEKGLAIASGRAVLRRILSLQQGSWFQDTGMVWWLEWRVVEEL